MESIRVAVCIRPLLAHELPADSIDHLTVDPAEKQVRLRTHAFTFDYIYGGRGSPYSSIFDECVAPIVDTLFDGYNGTIIAYGQTGSGKTYTMGISCNGEGHGNGIIPKVMDVIFSKVEIMEESTKLLIKVSFIEVSNQQVHDLLDPESRGSTRDSLHVREEVGGNITLVGVREQEVRTKKEMDSYLQQGSLIRATESTKMNSQSSRSHAVFTISMEQRRISHSSVGDDVAGDVLMAKLRLVDLAGSEQVKRAGADGARLQEGININKGLLALRNVIKALGDDKKRKEGMHIPYRDHRLTRILKDSLGGNSKTIMIDVRETLSTLRYASLARKIQNIATINYDPKTAKIREMQSQIKELLTDLGYSRGGGPHEEIKILKHKVSLLEASNKELKEALEEYEQRAIILKNRVSSLEASNKELKERLQECQLHVVTAEVERDRVIKQMESIQNEKSLDEIITKADKVKLQSSEDNGTDSQNPYPMGSDIKTGETDAVEEELEHSSPQEKLTRELKQMDKRLEREKLALGSPSTPHDGDTPEDLNVSNGEDSEWVPTIEGRRGKARIRKDMKIKGVCCSCKKHSQCKTSRCRCRARNCVCHLSCTCEPTTCSNRQQK